MAKQVTYSAATMPANSHTTSQIGVRVAGPKDAAAIAAVHVASWRETYSDLLPQSMLDALSVAERTGRWERILNDMTDTLDASAFVAEWVGEAVGFASGCNQRDETLGMQGFTGEISAIYVLKRAQRQGAGGRLLRAVALSLCDQGHKAASLWVLRDNQPARRFYERLGAVVEGEKEDRDSATLVELAYGWRDLSVLVNRSHPIISKVDN
jgi:ribosomal protein S18 acetylase RimI-like enzyme